jgi:3-hydroxyacyl-[acyl-carrier-protein] dehydratase
MSVPLEAFLEVEVEDCEDGGFLVRAVQDVDPGEPYIRGHFPGFAIYPGVFLIETVAQATAAALDPSTGNPPRVTGVRSMRFLAPLLAGDSVLVEARVRHDRDEPGAVEVDATCKRGGDGTRVASLKLTMKAPDPPHA